MTAAVIGLAATLFAALAALLGTLRTGRAPAHLADVEGLARLVQELRAELDRKETELTRAERQHGDPALREQLMERQRQLSACQRQLAECWGRVRDLREGTHGA